MRKMSCIGMVLCCFVIGHAEAQKVDDDLLIDSIKTDITQFFIKEGLLNKQKVKGSRNYVFATEIKQKRSIGYDTNGIYQIGVYHDNHKSGNFKLKAKVSQN